MMALYFYYALTGILIGFIFSIVFLSFYRLWHNRRKKKLHGYSSMQQMFEFKADSKILDKGRNDESLSDWK